MQKTDATKVVADPTRDYKEETTRAYDRYVELFEKKFAEHFHLKVHEFSDHFMERLPGKKILDLGSGAGTHAEYFTKHGFEVTCADISEEMVKRCQALGLKADLTDIETLQYSPHSFDGIWMYCSLLHIPKANIPAVIRQLHTILKPGGLLALAVQEGQTEGFRLADEKKYPGTQRYFAYFQDEEIRSFFTPWFTVGKVTKDPIKNKYVFLHYFMDRK